MDTHIPLFIHGHDTIDTNFSVEPQVIFGHSKNKYCGLDGDTLAVARPLELNSGRYGRVYIYRNTRTSSDIATTDYVYNSVVNTQNDNTYYFGIYGVEVSDDYLVVASSVDDWHYIIEFFHWNGSLFEFTEEYVIEDTQPIEKVTISLDGRVLGLAVYNDSHGGSVYIFNRFTTGAWTVVKYFNGADLGCITGGNISVTNVDNLTFTAFQSFDGPDAFIHVSEEGITASWSDPVEIRKAPGIGGNFGFSMDIDGDTLVVANPPDYFSVYTYDEYGTPDKWTLHQDVPFYLDSYHFPFVVIDDGTIFTSSDAFYTQADNFITYRQDAADVWKKMTVYNSSVLQTSIGVSVSDLAIHRNIGVAIDGGWVHIYDLNLSNSPTLFIEGGYPSSSIPLYTQAEVPYSTTMNLYLDGSHYMYNTLTLHIGAPSKTMTLFTKSAYFDQYNLLPLYIASPEGNSTTLYTLGHEILSYSPLTLFTKGKGLLNEIIPLFTHGAQLDSTARFLYLEAAATGAPNSYIDLFMIGGNVGSSYYESNIPLFIQNDDDHLRSIFLYIKNDETELYANRSVYLYLKSETPSITATLPCYIQNDGLYEVITLHVQGAGMFPGFSVSKRGIPLFIGRDGISKGVPLFCKAIDNSSNSYISLFTRSTIAENEHIPLYIDGYGLSNSYINLHTNGTYLDNSSLNLIMPNVIAIPTSTLLLYTHGY